MNDRQRSLSIGIGIGLGAGLCAVIFLGAGSARSAVDSGYSAFPIMGGLAIAFIDNSDGKMHVYSGMAAAGADEGKWIKMETYDLKDVGRDTLIPVWKRPTPDGAVIPKK